VQAWARHAVALWFGPTDGVRVALFERMLTYGLFVYSASWFRHASEWLTTDGYHPSGAVSNGLQLPVPALPPGALWWFAAVYFGSMVAVALGLGRRVALPILWCCLLYVTTVDRLSAFSMNKIYLVVYLVLWLAPLRDGGDRLASAWPLRTLQATLILQYFGAGVCKAVHGDWLAHADTLWYQMQLPYRTPASAWMVRELPMNAFAAMQHAALLFELLAPLLFLVVRLRPIGMLWGLGMHLMIALTMHKVGLFALQNLAFYVLFIPPERLTALWHRMRITPQARAGDSERTCS
jgi:hypothetical protein